MMPAWIREQDASPAMDSFKTPTGSTGRSRDKMVRSRGRGEGRGLQTVLQNHFRYAHTGGGGSSTKSSSANGAQVMNGKRRMSLERDHKGAKKRRWQSTTPEASPLTTEDGDETVTAFDGSFIEQALSGRPGDVSQTPKARTPRKSGKISLTSKRTYPAISPSKRRVLLTDTQRDVAMQQQHRRSPRSSSPLQPIENTANSHAHGGRMARSNSTSLTPSKLRHGYSLLAFDEGEESHMMSSDCVDEAEQENSPSPSAERRERADSAFRLAYTRSPRSNKRIYAQETLQTPQSPLDKFNEMRERELREICERYETGKRGNETGESSSQNTLLLSSPPPSSPGAYGKVVREDAENLLSSQTAPGGSFSIRRDTAEGAMEDRDSVMMETYMSEEELIEDDIRRDCGDETFRLPSSQDVETPFRVHDVKRALRSSTKSKEKQREADVDFIEGEETQPLSWSPSKEAAERQNVHKTNRRDHVHESWNELGKVWNDVKLSAKQNGSQIARGHQSSLHSFGFSREGRGETSAPLESNLAISNDITFASDEEVESENEEHHESRSDEETQELAWSDEVEVESSAFPRMQRREESGENEAYQASLGQSQLMMMMLPDENDLNTQGRDWLNRL